MKQDILLMGPLTNKKEAELTGGAIVLFQNLVSELHQIEYEYVIIDTNKRNYKNVFFAYLSIIFQLLIKQHGVNQISLHSSRDYIFLAPLIIIVGKVFRKKTSLRKFGGEVWDTYTESKGFKRFILNVIFKKIDYLFLEMKFLVENLATLNSNTHLFPNVRRTSKLKIENKKFSKKFVFISHVKESKGIDEIVDVVKLLDNSYTIDIYGIIVDSKYSEKYFSENGISYKGALLGENVLSTLLSYDVILLPSRKEGYPGILIEGYSLGKPIIATNLQGISEIVDDYKSGILIEKNNVSSLKNAIEYFNEDNYDEMSNFAKEKFMLFNSTKQTKLFLDILLSSNA